MEKNKSENKLFKMKKHLLLLLNCLLVFSSYEVARCQSAMINVYARNSKSLNGDWKVIVDPARAGDYRQVWLEKKPQKKTDFFEYSFDEGPVLHVPGDFNTQMPELAYYESIIWYKKTFVHQRKGNQRIFLHFGAVNYMADVFLNGRHIGSHEGGFTPFQFELTDYIREGDNTIVVKVDNQRRNDGIPGMGFDWFNYGGITRDVTLIETPVSYVEDYFIQLKKNSLTEVLGWVKLNNQGSSENITIRIPELKVNYSARTDDNGIAIIRFTAGFKLWSPENPVLYNVIIESEKDNLTDEIGFRSIETQGTQLLLNGKPLFIKGVNIHEERPLEAARAYTGEDALILLTWAKDLGCNLVRLAHYPHSEHMVRLAEKMGLMVWDEIPVYQHVEFSAPGFSDKMNLMMNEMMRRDRNRCSVVVWSLSNETYTNTPERSDILTEMTLKCRDQDSSRLITSVLSNQRYENNSFEVWDPLCKILDVICINEYLGWYVPRQGNPAETKWNFVVEKPLIISEFGGESKYGTNYGPGDEAAWWNEEYQERIYLEQIEMFRVTPNLAGVCPWILVDYRSPVRMHPLYQGGYNRKGLLSEHGEKKKAWYVMNNYYKTR